ncbi:R-spondin-3 [Chelonia mydas]|uniref:R-spondin-3 n=1 Tax=Chelonia mydas TaxID=8469 RepID=M7B0Y0_CHEMY|nr:R-spondin-3 [Chelonia mydas]
MKQIGVCLSSCPSGYFGTRYPEINKCTKCKADCDTCFTKNFCTKCKSGFYLHNGKCLENCPEGLEPNNHTMECTSIGGPRVMAGAAGPAAHSAPGPAPTSQLFRSVKLISGASGPGHDSWTAWNRENQQQKKAQEKPEQSRPCQPAGTSESPV